jgi:hypothetical protein
MLIEALELLRDGPGNGDEAVVHAERVCLSRVVSTLADLPGYGGAAKAIAIALAPCQILCPAPQRARAAPSRARM